MDFVLPQSTGIQFNLSLILILVAIGVVIFCCGICVALYLVQRYHKKKLEILHQKQSSNQTGLEMDELDPYGIPEEMDFYGNKGK